MFGCLAGLITLKALAATVALRLTGLGWRASGGTGLGLAHVGEFAFVLLLLGWTEGILSDAIYTRFITLAIGSLVLTPLLLKLGLHQAKAQPLLNELQRAVDHSGLAGRQAIVVGAGLVGRRVATHLETTGHDVCLVDRSPINLHPFNQQGFRTTAGDATHPQVMELAGADTMSLLVICIADDLAAIRIVRDMRSRNSTCFILVRCRFQSNVAKLTSGGADRVVSEEAQTSDSLLRILGNAETENSDP